MRGASRWMRCASRLLPGADRPGAGGEVLWRLGLPGSLGAERFGSVVACLLSEPREVQARLFDALLLWIASHCSALGASYNLISLYRGAAISHECEHVGAAI